MKFGDFWRRFNDEWQCFEHRPVTEEDFCNWSYRTLDGFELLPRPALLPKLQADGEGENQQGSDGAAFGAGRGQAVG